MAESNPVDQLNTFCSNAQINAPIYTFEMISANEFISTVRTFNLQASGSGTSKKKARHAAVTNFLLVLRQNERVIKRVEDLRRAPTFIPKLHAMCLRMRISRPVYVIEETSKNPNENFLHIIASCTVNDQKFTGSATLPKQAKEAAAKKAYIALETPGESNSLPNSEISTGQSSIETLIHICHERGLPNPIYSQVEASCKARKSSYKYACMIGEGRKDYGTSSTKTKAKQAAAEKMLIILRAEPIQSIDSASSINRENVKISHNSIDAGDAASGSALPSGNEASGSQDYVDTNTVKGRIREATASTEVQARKKAAKQMVDSSKNGTIRNGKYSHVPALELRSVQEAVAEYKRIKGSGRIATSNKLERLPKPRNPFAGLSEEIRVRAIQVIISDGLLERSSEEIIDAICTALEVEYEISIPTHPNANNMRTLELKNCATDPVFIEERAALGVRLVRYCYVMLRMKKWLLAKASSLDKIYFGCVDAHENEKRMRLMSFK